MHSKTPLAIHEVNFVYLFCRCEVNFERFYFRWFLFLFFFFCLALRTTRRRSLSKYLLISSSSWFATGWQNPRFFTFFDFIFHFVVFFPLWVSFVMAIKPMVCSARAPRGKKNSDGTLGSAHFLPASSAFQGKSRDLMLSCMIWWC